MTKRRYAGLAGITLLALLSVAVFVYGEGWMNVSTASAEGHDAQTKAYVDSAMEYYADRGLGKTVERYGNPLSWDGRTLPHRRRRPDPHTGVLAPALPEREKH